MAKRTPVKRAAITREVAAKAIRRMRTERGMSQVELGRRARAHGQKDFGRLLESQISDFERGRTLPSFGSLVNYLTGCSPDGTEVDFSLLQDALESVLSGDEEEVKSVSKAAKPVDWQKRFLDLENSIEQRLEQAKDEIALLRSRIVLMERQLETAVLTMQPQQELLEEAASEKS